jgi:hypothetical protein
MFVTVILAPLTTAPVGSVIVPTILPVPTVVWAIIEAAVKRQRHVTTSAATPLWILRMKSEEFRDM